MTLCDKNYFTEKYDLTRTHSDVVEAAKVVAPGKTPDLSCGNGRNSLYLAANGYGATTWDKNPMSIANLEHVKATGGPTNLNAKITDLNMLCFEGEYDFTPSTVMLMLLEAKTVSGLIENVQRCIKSGGYNLIITAMDTDDFPCTVGSPFASKSGGLRNHCSGWDLLKCNEDAGELHRTDGNGNRIKPHFAIILARKTSRTSRLG